MIVSGAGSKTAREQLGTAYSHYYYDFSGGFPVNSGVWGVFWGGGGGDGVVLVLAARA